MDFGEIKRNHSGNLQIGGSGLAAFALAMSAHKNRAISLKKNKELTLSLEKVQSELTAQSKLLQKLNYDKAEIGESLKLQVDIAAQ